MTDPAQEVTLRKISDQVNALTAKYGGLMWGEHGKGFRSEYSPTFLVKCCIKSCAVLSRLSIPLTA